jgi:hypothetical protein
VFLLHDGKLLTVFSAPFNGKTSPHHLTILQKVLAHYTRAVSPPQAPRNLMDAMHAIQIHAKDTHLVDRCIVTIFCIINVY